jgi:pilus assembly protein Flp/PilA
VALTFRARKKPRSPLRAQPQEVIVRTLLARFFADESGATAIEYALIAAGISIVILVAVNGIGDKLNSSFSTVNTSLK